MNKTYFIWIGIHFLVWLVAIASMTTHLNEIQLASLCLFFLLLFLLPLFAGKSTMQMALFLIQILATTVIFYPDENGFYPFLLFVQALVLAEAVFYLPRLKSLIVIGVQISFMLLIVAEVRLSISELAWIGLFYLLLLLSLLYYQSIHIRQTVLIQKHGALLEEYRKMKRQLVTEEEQARQGERMLIGHEIHDSVGHKLTALLMQFEAFRLTAAEKDKQKIAELKKLAEQSLEETRKAVKSFKQKDVGGLQGVIRLIRQLEMESFMKIHFSVKHGAFAASLSGEQSFAVYRAVQEALTNIMKHSSTREVQVMFESPGGSIFRFEVANEATPNPYFQEGYGLKAMRDRLEKVDGSMDVIHDGSQFVVRGSIRLADRRG